MLVEPCSTNQKKKKFPLHRLSICIHVYMCIYTHTTRNSVASLNLLYLLSLNLFNLNEDASVHFITTMKKFLLP